MFIKFCLCGFQNQGQAFRGVLISVFLLWIMWLIATKKSDHEETAQSQRNDINADDGVEVMKQIKQLN